MARTYTGYRKTIEELDDADTTLLKKHMDNLLNCISEDSSRFLKTEGEQHPFNFFSAPSFLKTPPSKNQE